MRYALFCLLLLVATPACADDDTPPRPAVEISAQSFRGPGPGEGETRDVFVWRPAGAEGVLPVLYMADGFTGLRLVAHQIAPYIAAGEAPVTIRLDEQDVTAADGQRWTFAIDGEAKAMLREGLDAIDLTLLQSSGIADWQARDRAARPWIYLENRA